MLLETSLLLILTSHIVCQMPSKDFQDQNTEMKLHKDLLRGYNKYKPPQNITSVAVRFILKYFKFDEEEVVFSMHSWILLNWVDERLKWNPDDYSAINVTEIISYKIWTPMMECQNAFELDDLDLSVYDCLSHIRSSGHLSCVHRVTIEAACNTNLTDWPFDVQTCTIKFGVDDAQKNKVNLTFNSSRGISMFGAEYGPGWDIIDFDKGENTSTGTHLYFSFVLERNGVGMAAMIVVPFLVLSVLTVSSLFIEPCGLRLGVTIFSLMGHFKFSHVISEMIPKHSATSPTVLRYVNGSMSFTCIAVILCFVLSSLRQRRKSTPQWICGVNEFVFKSPGRFLVFPRWETRKGETVDEYDRAMEDWSDFANVVNSVTIVLALIVYQSVFFAYIPRERPINYDM